MACTFSDADDAWHLFSEAGHIRLPPPSASDGGRVLMSLQVRRMIRL